MRANWAVNGSADQREEIRDLERRTGLAYSYTEVWLNGARQETYYHVLITEPTIARKP